MSGLMVPNGKHIRLEPLVPDERLEPLFYRFQRKMPYPAGMEFVTYIQEPNEKIKERKAVFMVRSMHPRPHVDGEMLVTGGSMPLLEWLKREAERKHYVGVGDPLQAIFAGLLNQHMQYRKNLEELI